MNAALKGSCLVGVGIWVVFSGGPARAAESPLLVVVEAPPALDADAAEIRRAIGVELRAQTIAPMQRSAEPPGRALIVAFNRDRIAMSLRTNDATPIARDIPTPSDRAARVRAIAWLAGNLARDQVSPILAEEPAETSPLASMPPLAVTRADTEPPPLTGTPPNEPPPASNAPVIVATHAPDLKSSGPARWSIGIADGATTYFPVSTGGPNESGSTATSYSPELWNPFNAGLRSGLRGSAWRIEVQRRTKKDGRFWGAALGGTAGNFAPQLLGVTALLGSAKHWGRWSFEPTIDAGLELSKLSFMETNVSISSSSGVMRTYSDAVQPALCADGALAVAHPVSESFDAVLRLGVHATTAQMDNWFLSATLGLRYNL